ncbi:hypothetical protein PoB_004692000 [Plakobranchus ocellatus]|uniref:Uncharacterized protein n=1 Tax=Plakobranchus ocellatus TaxID=259542 RepID=A0AAV4BN04_9GAST|nr:hypothetical protein PoB_004692000 [Plakobranchus ocellatus]
MAINTLEPSGCQLNLTTSDTHQGNLAIGCQKPAVPVGVAFTGGTIGQYHKEHIEGIWFESNQEEIKSAWTLCGFSL